MKTAAGSCVLGRVRDERAADAQVELADARRQRLLVGPQSLDDRLADAIVIRLDQSLGAVPADPDELRGAQIAEQLQTGAGVELRRAHDHGDRDGRAGQGHQLEEALRRLVELGEAAPQHVLQVEQPGLGVRHRAEVADELGEEQRVAGSFLEQRGERVRAGAVRSAGPQRGAERAGLLARQSAEVEDA